MFETRGKAKSFQGAFRLCLKKKVSDMELDMVADMEVDKVADMVADIIGHRVGLFGPNFFNPKLTWLAHLLRITSSF